MQRLRTAQEMHLFRGKGHKENLLTKRKRALGHPSERAASGSQTNLLWRVLHPKIPPLPLPS